MQLLLVVVELLFQLNINSTLSVINIKKRFELSSKRFFNEVIQVFNNEFLSVWTKVITHIQFL